jgi:polysaccharide biosynthesis protein PslG
MFASILASIALAGAFVDGAFVDGAFADGASPRVQDTPRPAVPEGWGVAVGFDAESSAEVEMMRAAGVRIVRLDLFWHRVEREKGVFDFSEYERRVQRLLAAGIRPMLILDYGNDLYQQGSPRSPEARSAFVRYAREALKRFRDQGVLWEMWNEPNGHLYWHPRPNVREYIELATDVGELFLAEAPGEELVGPAVAGIDMPFLEACFRSGLLRYWSGVTVHPYRNEEPETVALEYARLKELVRRHAPPGRRIGILSGEWGYTTADRAVTHARQADYMLRQYLVNLMSGIDATIWYCWKNSDVDPDAGETRFGLVLADLRPKRGYDLRKAFVEAMRGYRFNKRIDLGDPRLFCLLFENGEDQRLVAWSVHRSMAAAALPSGAAQVRLREPLGKMVELTPERGLVRVALDPTPIILEPVGPDPLLARATRLPELPRFATLGSPEEAFRLFAPFAPFREAVTLVDESAEWRSTVIGRDGGALPRLLDRSEEPRVVRVDVRLGATTISQAVHLSHRSPLTVGLASPLQGRWAVIAGNPTGEPFDGRLTVVTDRAQYFTPLVFEEGDLTVRKQLQDVPNLFPSERVRLVVEERTSGGFREVIRSPSMRIHWHEEFSGAEPQAPMERVGFVGRLDGDPKVESFHRGTVVDAPPGLSQTPIRALKIDFAFSSGWKYLEVNLVGDRARPLAGEPAYLGMWVFGDGSGATLRMRFEDASGQTFQPDYGVVDWTGWRFVKWPLHGRGAGRWGGANDGVVRHPIRITTPLLIDNTVGAGATGSIVVTGIFVAGG